ncbi:RHS repeat-associated core domain-containing protein [Pseudomonas sp. CCOS 191]|uniref:RHS repeat-associated core domain-containing protein n=1 Tax=Pseudomonas sp. CCOS 191 TaxID=1649877 RepID=UPI001E33D106|nr:RHS repeat-associated core domain-containing protein [Pseudomonas sp. CCOS 191]
MATTTSFEYEPKTQGTFRAEPVLLITQTVTGHDHQDNGEPEDARRKTVTAEHSQFTGEQVLIKDHNGVSVQIEQNELGQVITEIVAPGEGAYEARRTFMYALCPNNGSWDFPEDEQVHQSMTTARGVKTVTYADGLGRPVREERDHIDERDENTRKLMKETVTLAYDALGQKTRVTTIDYRSIAPTEAQPSPAPEPLPLITRFSYDGWGEELCVQGPDQVKRYTENDPTGQGKHDGYIRTEWAQSPEASFKISDKRQTWLNLFDKPDQVHRLDAQGHSCAIQHYEYDGLGNTKAHVNEREYATHYDFDAWNRMTRTTLADGTRVNRCYTEHSNTELPTQVYLDRETGKLKWGQDWVEGPVVLGTRSYDGVDRLTVSQTGERQETLLYLKGKMQPDLKTNNAQQKIGYEYDLLLRETPTIKIADDTATLTLNKTNGLLETAVNDLGKRVYDYDWNSRTKKETWQSDDGSSRYSVEQGTSPLGRLNWQRVEGGPENLMTYNAYGQLQNVAAGDLHTTLHYDTLGRLSKIELDNNKTQETLVTVLDYNVHGQEEKRTFTRKGQPERTLEQKWWPDGLLRSRELKEAGTSWLKEDFTYDERSRLIGHECSGRDLPRTPEGREYAKQTFNFDAFDNIIQCETHFADHSKETATFHYEYADPCQLTRVVYSPERSGTPARFTYDANGCQELDEKGRAVAHDSQRRLTSVGSVGQGSAGRYGYDAHDNLTTRPNDASTDTTALYFQGNRLRLAIRDAQVQTHLLYAGDMPLGQQDTSTDGPTLMFSCNASGSVINESLEAHAKYSAYGERFDALASLLGFNGESLDPVSGWYLLGRGHRAYNPTLMRFLSPDALSPFNSGGINCYAYCQGNPITFRDPTGRSRSLGEDGSRSLGNDGTRTLEMTPQEIWEASMRPSNSPWKSLLIGIVFTAMAIAGAVFTAGASLAPTIAAAAAVGTTMGYGAAFVASSLAVQLTVAIAVAGTAAQIVTFGLETAANFGMEELYKPLEITNYASLGFMIGDGLTGGVLSRFTGGSGKPSSDIVFEWPKPGSIPRVPYPRKPPAPTSTPGDIRG